MGGKFGAGGGVVSAEGAAASPEPVSIFWRDDEQPQVDVEWVQAQGADMVIERGRGCDVIQARNIWERFWKALNNKVLERGQKKSF